MGAESILYAHAYLDSQIGEDGDHIDRRKIAPPHKWLYISVEVAWGDCKYLIQATKSSISIQLTKRELKCLAGQTKAAGVVEKHINQIKQNENEMQELYEKCRSHQKKKHGGKNIVEANTRIENIPDPRAKYIHAVIDRVQKCRREDQVVKRQQNDLKAKIEQHEALKIQLTSELKATEEPMREQERRMKYWTTELTKVSDVVIKAEARILQMELDKRELNSRLHELKGILEKQLDTEKTTRSRLEEIKLALAEKEQEVSKLRIAARLKNIKLPADLK